MKKNTAVFISGHGSNLQALIDAAQHPDYPARLSLVISNIAGAYGLVRAEEAGIPTRLLAHRDFHDREAYDAALHQLLLDYEIELVCLAGFMRLLTPGFTTAWEGRMLNIHPSLLPAFKGLNTHAAVLAAGAKFTGCTVHFVVPEMDAGPMIIQAAIPVASEDTAQSLAQKVHRLEHQLYPQALSWVAAGKVRMEKGATVYSFTPPVLEETLINPALER